MKLVYALVDGAAEAALPGGLGGEPLAYVRKGPVAAIVGEVDESRPPAAEHLRAHDALLRRLALLHDSLLPSRFGVVLPDAQALLDILDARAVELVELLSLVRGREQMTLRVFGEDPAPAPLEIPSAGPGARYLLARKAAEDRARSLPALGPLRAALGELLRAERISRHEAPPLLATVAHLVDRGHGDDYRARVAEVTLTVRVTVSGPWPVYSFAAEATP